MGYSPRGRKELDSTERLHFHFHFSSTTHFSFVGYSGPYCSWSSLVAQMVKRLPAMQETWVQSLGREHPLEKEMAAHSSVLAGKSNGQRSLMGHSPRYFSVTHVPTMHYFS